MFRGEKKAYQLSRATSRIVCGENTYKDQSMCTCKCAHVKLMMDSAAAVAYINKMGGTYSHTVANLAIALWEWYLKNLLMVSAQHLPGKLNIRADRESRVLTNSSN